MAKAFDRRRLQKYCRACLSQIRGSKHEIENLPKEVFEIFEQMTGYTKAHQNLYPKCLCEACCKKIKSFVEFQNMVTNNAKFLDFEAEKVQEKTEDTKKETIAPQPEEQLCILNADNLKEATTINADPNSQEKSIFENVFLSNDLKVESEDLDGPNIENSPLDDTLFLPQVAEVKFELNIEDEDATAKNEDFVCETCNLRFSTVELLKLHMRIHKELRSHKCTLCEKAFNKKSRLNVHVKEKHEKKPIKINCKFNCGKTFTRSETADAHYKSKHNAEEVNDGDELEKNVENIAQRESDETSEDNFNLLFLSKTTCKICQKTLSSPTALKLHMHVHAEKRPFQCDKCERGFNKKLRLQEHIRENHAEKPFEIVCKYGCGKRFLRTQTAAAHYRNKHPPKKDITAAAEPNNEEDKAQAEHDSKNIPDDSNVETGVDKSEQDPNDPVLNKLTCKVCLQNYSSPSTLRVHMRLHRDKLPYQCDHCGRGFNKRGRLNLHIAEVHSNQQIRIECKGGCGKVFRRRETAKGHYYRKHVLPEKGIQPKKYSFVCEDCGKVFTGLSSLKEHSFAHRPAEERPFKCDRCCKTFISKRYFEDHLLRHAGVKNFECSHCGIKKTTRRDLRTHFNNYHSETKKTYSCVICEKLFNRLGNLRLHERVVHQGIKRYKCSYCDQAFGKPDTLKHHVMRHTGERPHKCDICDRGFIQAVALRTHMKTHNT